jgi:hypothetical protein
MHLEAPDFEGFLKEIEGVKIVRMCAYSSTGQDPLLGQVVTIQIVITAYDKKLLAMVRSVAFSGTAPAHDPKAMEALVKSAKEKETEAKKALSAKGCRVLLGEYRD